MEMNELKTSQRLYDITEYSEKVRSALEKLKKTQKPGEQSKRKAERERQKAVRNMLVEDFRSVLDDGHTVSQLADALTEGDVDKILPERARALLEKEEQPHKIVKMAMQKVTQHMMVAEFTAVLNEGHTVLQLAVALTEGDVDKILPESVTELMEVLERLRTPLKNNNHSPWGGTL